MQFFKIIYRKCQIKGYQLLLSLEYYHQGPSVISKQYLPIKSLTIAVEVGYWSCFILPLNNIKFQERITVPKVRVYFNFPVKRFRNYWNFSKASSEKLSWVPNGFHNCRKALTKKSSVTSTIVHCESQPFFFRGRVALSFLVCLFVNLTCCKIIFSSTDFLFFLTPC